MNPPRVCRFSCILFVKADAGAAVLLNDLIDTCVMECYIHDLLAIIKQQVKV